MSDIHHELVLAAKNAIDKVHSDTSVDKEQTAISLQEIIDEIEVMLDALKE